MDVLLFGNFIKERRKEKGLTQKQLADIIDVTDKAISRWENGHGFPDIESLEPLANALDVSLWELMHSQMDQRELVDKAEVELIISEAINISVNDILKVKRKKFVLFLIIGLLIAIIVFLMIFSIR